MTKYHGLLHYSSVSALFTQATEGLTMVDFVRNRDTDLDRAANALVADILDDTVTQPDPHHVLEYLSAQNNVWRSSNHGTSFVFFPCTTCFIHKVPEPEGQKIRHTIIRNLLDRLYYFLSDAKISFEEVRYDFFHRGVSGFNNGEIYLWLHNVTIPNDVAWVIVMSLQKSLEETPILLPYFGKQYEMKFYGQGVRQL